MKNFLQFEGIASAKSMHGMELIDPIPITRLEVGFDVGIIGGGFLILKLSGTLHF